MVGVCDAAVTGSGIRLTFAADLDPASVKSSAFRAFREDDSKKGPEPPEYKLGKAHLINPRTVEINVPDISKEALSDRTDEKGNVSVEPPISLSYKLRSKNGTTFEQTIYATINSIPLKEE